ncbi:hypothetical protein KR093_007003, partial [Drosophila rubida]
CITGHVTFTNLKCLSGNNTLIDFKHCYIKAVNRTHKYISIHINNYVQGVRNITMNIKVLRFSNGYKPFYIDVTFDTCKYLKKQRNPLVNLIFKAIQPATNLNHSCPYNVCGKSTCTITFLIIIYVTSVIQHDLIMDKFWTGNHEVELLKYLPVPNGDYVLIVTLYIYNSELLTVHTYLHLTS